MVNHQKQGLFADVIQRDMHAGKRWHLCDCTWLIIKSNNRNILRDPQSGLLNSPHGPDGRIIIARNNCREFDT
jgi:hypothetical protein